MTVFDCINGLKRDGLITEQQAQSAKDMIEAEIAATTGLGPKSISKAVAAQNALTRLRDDATVKARQKQLQLLTNKDIVDRMQANAGKIGSKRAAQAIYTRDVFDGVVQDNVEKRADAWRKEAFAIFGERSIDAMPSIRKSLRRTGNKAIARETKAENEDIYKALVGTSREKQTANNIADGYKDARDFLVDQLRRAGAVIPKLNDFDVPHIWNSDKVGKSFDDWYNFVRPRLDDARMQKVLNDVMGPTSDFEGDLRNFLKASWENIRTNGLDDTKPLGAFSGKTKLANRRDVHRYLHFKEDKWLEVNNEFGTDEVFGNMMRHLDSLAKDLALLETHGPDVEQGFRVVQDMVRRQMNKEGASSQSIKSAVDSVSLFQNITAGKIVPAKKGVAEAGGALRNWLSAAYLGSTALTAVLGDFFTNAWTAKWNGSSFGKTMEIYLKQFAQAKNSKKAAAQMGFLYDVVATQNLAMYRISGELLNDGFITSLADTVMRASGLSFMTEAARMVTPFVLVTEFADNAGKAFDALDTDLAATLRRYGITSDEWNVIRKNVSNLEGIDVIDTRKMISEDANRETAIKFNQLLATERDFGTITTNLRTEAFAIGESRAGTTFGEARRGFAQFKRWPMTVIQTHMTRYAASAETGGLFSKAGWQRSSLFLGGFASTGFLAGYMAEQMNLIANGRDPQPMSPELAARSMMRGGALGIYGDLIGKIYNGRRVFDEASIVGFLGGPQATFLIDTGRLALEPFINDQTVEESISNIVPFLGRNVPGASIWYSKLWYRRMLLEPLEQYINPQASERLRRQRRKARKKDQTFFFGPLDDEPRLPDLDRALE